MNVILSRRAAYIHQVLFFVCARVILLRAPILFGQAERQAKAFVTEAVGESFYYRARGPLCTLLAEPFLTSCVLKGNFSALALNAASDQGNSFAILPGGTLVLSLDRESFQARIHLSHRCQRYTYDLLSSAGFVFVRGSCKLCGCLIKSCNTPMHDFDNALFGTQNRQTKK